MNPIIFLLKMLLFNNNNTKGPVRLAKKQEPKQLMINEDMELLLIGLFLMIMLICFCFIFITSCTDSGLIYNNHHII